MCLPFGLVGMLPRSTAIAQLAREMSEWLDPYLQIDLEEVPA
jgi:hypothetical protein